MSIHKKAQAEGFWKVIGYMLALAVLLFFIIYYAQLKEKLFDLVNGFSGIFK